jgi:hypothetical protein
MLHVAGEAPLFASPAPEQEPAQPESADGQASPEEPSGEGASRITKYVPRPRKIGTGYLAKGKPAAGKRPFDRDGSRNRSEGFKPRTAARDDRERRPFRKPADSAPERRFDKPWDEGRPRRSAEAAGDSRPARKPRPAGDRQDPERREYRSGPRPPRRDEGRPERRPRPQGGDRNRSDARPYADRRREGSSFQKRDDRQGRERTPRSAEEGTAPARPAFRRFDDPKRNDRRPPRQQGARPQSRERSGEFEPRRPRREGASTGRPPRREGGFEVRPPRRESGSEGRPPRREGGFNARPDSNQGGKRPFGKSKFGGGSGKFAKSPAKKPFQKKPSDRTFRPRRDESA